jgi:mannose-1-phosphate guanylyltransferase/mannose-6-phosphate isomerase
MAIFEFSSITRRDHSVQETILGFVMSGGVGSRLWPLSREDNPKQFHALSGDGSMLVKTVKRIAARTNGPVVVNLIAAGRHAERVNFDLAGVDLKGGRGIFEPKGRNTAAAVAVAAQVALAAGDTLALVVPSDHEITTTAQFWNTIELGVPAAHEGRVVVFGITPNVPETGFGYIECGPEMLGSTQRDVLRFVEKPDIATAEHYLNSGNFLWNAGIFLFRASVMRDAFLKFAPDIWNDVAIAYACAEAEDAGLFLQDQHYSAIRSEAVDTAIMEKLGDIAVIPAQFRWSDLGSWQSLLDVSPTDDNGNVIIGDVVAIDCKDSYLRSEGRLLSVIGLEGMAVVATHDATFVAPVTKSQNVKQIVERLEKTGRLETRITPVHDRMPETGSHAKRIRHWLFEETLPLWSNAGLDRINGGFHEALTFHGEPVLRDKRMRTMARQIYAFGVAHEMGWTGPSLEIIEHGIAFIEKHGRSKNGGWVKVLAADGAVVDETEDAYDHACVLLALAYAAKAGHTRAKKLGEETFAYLDKCLTDDGGVSFKETASGGAPRRSNPHMHLLEAFLAWHKVTGESAYLDRATKIVDLFANRFFDSENWTLGEFFDSNWQPLNGDQGEWTEPGHHFEWASLLVAYASASGRSAFNAYARKLYSSAIANGLNRATGLAYDVVTKTGIPLVRTSRSWPQTEALKAAIALDRIGGPDMKPEIEARAGRLFRWHIEPAPQGMWIDLIDEKGRAKSSEVPASIFYHLVFALTEYLGVASPQ